MAVAEWLIAILVVAGCTALSVFASAAGRSSWGLPSLLPVAAGLFIRAGGIAITLPPRGWIVALSIAMVAMAVVSGGPLVTWVLELTDRSTEPPTSAGAEVLRGGATIGFLERIAVVAAVALGQVEIVAAVIAVKGLGRFGELDSSAARERFIIGTLVSLIWAGLVAGLIWPPS
jgi:mannitol-specific phosphotransferase system IIBC component